MKRFTLLCLLLLSYSAYAKDWSVIAKDDLHTIHDTLKVDSPNKVSNDESWVEQGFKVALQQSAKVRNFQDYLLVLRSYVYGFHIPHITLDKTVTLNVNTLLWPKLMIGSVNNEIQVTMNACSESDNCPEVGAVLTSCDGRPVEDWLTKSVYPYMTVNNEIPEFRTLFVPDLLINQGATIREYPKKCIFDDKTYSLIWEHYLLGRIRFLKDLSYSRGLNQQSLVLVNDVYRDFYPQLISHEIYNGINWVKISSFSGNYKDNLTKLFDNLKTISFGDNVVIDVRSNLGGMPTYARQLLEVLYGNKITQYQSMLPLYQEHEIIWRLSDDNMQFMKLATEKSKNPAVLKMFKPLFQSATKAKFNGAHEFRQVISAITASNSDRLKPFTTYVLTDEACRSTCWMFVRSILQLPNVYQIGRPTGIFDKDMQPLSKTLNSKLTSFRYPIGAQVKPSENLGKPFYPLPQYRYTGNPSDDNAINSWVRQLIEQNSNEQAR